MHAVGRAFNAERHLQFLGLLHQIVDLPMKVNEITRPIASMQHKKEQYRNPHQSACNQTRSILVEFRPISVQCVRHPPRSALFCWEAFGEKVVEGLARGIYEACKSIHALLQISRSFAVYVET